MRDCGYCFFSCFCFHSLSLVRYFSCLHLSIAFSQWVARDLNGEILSAHYPVVAEPFAQKRDATDGYLSPSIRAGMRWLLSAAPVPAASHHVSLVDPWRSPLSSSTAARIEAFSSRALSLAHATTPASSLGTSPSHLSSSSPITLPAAPIPVVADPLPSRSSSLPLSAFPPASAHSLSWLNETYGSESCIYTQHEECCASECLLFCKDLWSVGMTRFLVNPSILVTYNTVQWWLEFLFHDLLVWCAFGWMHILKPDHLELASFSLSMSDPSSLSSSLSSSFSSFSSSSTSSSLSSLSYQLPHMLHSPPFRIQCGYSRVDDTESQNFILLCLRRSVGLLPFVHCLPFLSLSYLLLECVALSFVIVVDFVLLVVIEANCSLRPSPLSQLLCIPLLGMPVLLFPSLPPQQVHDLSQLGVSLSSFVQDLPVGFGASSGVTSYFSDRRHSFCFFSLSVFIFVVFSSLLTFNILFSTETNK